MVTDYLVVGDATLDVIAAPERRLRPGGDVPAAIRVGPGGQAANVAVRLARAGVAVTLLAPIGDDPAGRFLTEALAGEGVVLRPLPAARSSTVVALLDEAGERSMLSDRQLLPAAEVRSALGGAGWIHVSGYALLDDGEGDALAEALQDRAAGVRLSVAGGSVPPEPEPAGRLRARLAVARPDLLLFSRDEAGALLAAVSPAAGAAARALAELAPLVVVTAGELGSAACSTDSLVEVPAIEPGEEVVDATGSGDAYLAALLHALAPDPWPPDSTALRSAMTVASRAGSRVARVPGAQGAIAGERAPGEHPPGEHPPGERPVGAGA